jgi:hypothetical protein
VPYPTAMVSHIARESTRPRTKKVTSTRTLVTSFNAYQNFLDSLQNPFTRRNYETHFQEFRKGLHLSSESCNELLEMDGRELEDLIVRYIKECAARGTATGSIQLKLSAIRKFFVENRQENQLNWSWLQSRIPKGNGKVKDRDYTKDELVKMWDQSDIRKKAVLALFMTGVRKGAIPELTVGSLAKITEYHDRRSREKQVHKFEGYHIYKLTVYEGSPEQYITFLTPAGAKAIDQYLEFRRTHGENITAAKSPLIRDAFDSVRPAFVNEPRRLTTNALDMMFHRLTRSVGIRSREKVTLEKKPRQDIMLLHGIRKYVNHAMVNSGVNVIAKELLLGHAAPGLEGSYLRPTESELLTEFVKAIPALSLSQEGELVQETERLRTEVADLDTMKRAYLELKAEKEQTEDRFAQLQQQLKQQQEKENDIARLEQQQVRDMQERHNRKLQGLERRLQVGEMREFVRGIVFQLQKKKYGKGEIEMVEKKKKKKKPSSSSSSSSDRATTTSSSESYHRKSKREAS